MTKPTDLMGLGLAAALAEALGFESSAVTCAGTAAGTATQIPTNLAQLTAASSQTGAKLPDTYGPVVLNTVSSTSAVVYPPSGTINGAASLTLAQNKTAIFFRYSSTLWFSILTA